MHQNEINNRTVARLPSPAEMPATVPTLKRGAEVAGEPRDAVGLVVVAGGIDGEGLGFAVERETRKLGKEAVDG